MSEKLRAEQSGPPPAEPRLRSLNVSNMIRLMTIGRRSFLQSAAAAALAWPRAIDALGQDLQTGGAPADEEFWSFVRGQFLIPSDRIYLNNGTLGPSPVVVVEAVAEHTRRVAATYPPGVRWENLKGALGSLLEADPEGFVFPRNTTEAMNFVANGIELDAGDEVLITDHEHIGGYKPWEMICARRGATLVVAHLPTPARSSEDLFDAVLAAMTPRTRVLALSHVTFTTGTVLPVTALARECRERSIIFAVDGAHPPGMLRVDLQDLGGDFYVSSPHKWLLAPQGTGLLYMTDEWRTRLWPTLASGGWDDLDLGAHRFNHFGTFDESRLAGLLAAVEFHAVLGVDRIEARVRHLRALLQAGLSGLAGIEIASPQSEELSSAMVSFRLEGVDSLALQSYLSRAAKVRTRVIGEYDYGWMRLSTHIYNRPSDLDRILELLEGVGRDGLPSGD
jgi:selenocysteine lyase/cysteine desulfurase